MHKRNTRYSSLTLITLLLAACGGGGGSDETAVSANPTEPPPSGAAPAPSPAPGGTPIPGAPGKVPDPAPAPSPTAPGPSEPPPAPAPGPTVSGPVVWAALQKGVSEDPAPPNFFTTYRELRANGSAVYLGGSLESYYLTPGPSGGSLMAAGMVSVKVVGSDGVIDAVTANNLSLSGPQLDLRNINPTIDTAASTWTNGQWYARLVVQSAESEDRMRVCWDVNLPPQLNGPTFPFKRLMCGVYSKTQAGLDVGGYLVDDQNGTKQTFSASW